VREEKTRHVPYKYKALETRKIEERRDREKGRERPKEKRSRKKGNKKKPKKKTTHNNKTQEQGKE
jgi:hypothetical protein